MIQNITWYGRRSIGNGLREKIRDKAREIFGEVAENYGFEIQEMRVAPDHVHIFLNFPPRYSIARVAGMLKSISAIEIFEKFPEG